MAFSNKHFIKGSAFKVDAPQRWLYNATDSGADGAHLARAANTTANIGLTVAHIKAYFQSWTSRNGRAAADAGKESILDAPVPEAGVLVDVIGNDKKVATFYILPDSENVAAAGDGIALSIVSAAGTAAA